MRTLAFDAGQDWSTLSTPARELAALGVIAAFAALPIGFFGWLIWLDVRARRRAEDARAREMIAPSPDAPHVSPPAPPAPPSAP